MEQLELPKETLKVDGLRDNNNPAIEYMGTAVRDWDGKWKCYAKVHSSLCIVEIIPHFKDKVGNKWSLR